MRKVITEAAIVARLIWFRVSCYFLIPFITTFLALTETWSQETWDQTGRFLVLRMLASCFVAGITSFVAFLDSSMGKAKDAIVEHRNRTPELPMEVSKLTEEQAKGV
jgi:hypothetical protein